MNDGWTTPPPDAVSAVAAATSEGEPRRALTRALASETRNALARIELAASEIDRFGQAPAIRLRVESIHSAVCEIDALLEKLDVVAGLAPSPAESATDLDDLLRRLSARVAPVLRARGLVLERVEEAPIAGGAFVRLPEFALESIVLGLFGVVVAALESPGLLELRVTRRRSDVEIALSRSIERLGGSLGPRAEALQLELDVELAEWGGRSEIEPARGTCKVWLPGATIDQERAREDDA